MKTMVIIKKEIFSKLATPRVVITYVFCFVLIITALVTGAATYQSLKSETVEFARAEKQRLSAISSYFSEFAQKGVELYREPNALAVLIAGVEGDSARRGTATLGSYAEFGTSKFNTTPILAVFGWLDLGFIVKIILSLFAIIFAYDTICGEKENGTLRLILSNGIKRHNFILGKFIGNFLLLIVPIILALLLGLLIVTSFSGIQFSQEDWIRIAMIFGTFILYLLTFFSVGIMVSALTHKSNISFLILLMVWLLSIGIIPRASVLIAQVLQPVPSIEVVKKEFVAEVSAGQQEVMSTIKDLMKELQKEAIQYQAKMAKGEITMQDFQAKVKELQSTMMIRLADRIAIYMSETGERGYELAREQEQKQQRQNALAISLSRVTSPSASLTFAVDRLAKVGVDSSDKVFRNIVYEYSHQLARFNRDLLKNNPEYIGSGNQPSADTIDLSEAYPDVNIFIDESLAVSASEALVDMAILAFLSLLFLAVTFIAFSRYDVR